MPYSDPEQQRDYHRQRQRSRRERGLCVNCSRPAESGLTRCGVCRADHATRNAGRGRMSYKTAAREARHPSQQPSGAPTMPETGDFLMHPDAAPTVDALTALLKADPKFQQSWDQNRLDMKDPSPSSYCTSLADTAIRAGWPDQEVVNLLICWRRIHGHDLKLRERYYELTITRVKEPIQMEREQRRLEEALFQSPEDEPEVLRDSLDKLFKAHITRIVRYLGDPPIFHLYTERGEITIGTIDKIYNQDRFREALGAATSIVIPKVSSSVWESRAQAILTLCEDVDLGDASHPDRETSAWVEDYLVKHRPRSEDEWEKAAQRRFPFIIGDRIRIFLDDLVPWLHTNRGRKMDKRALGARLRRIKADPDRVHLHVGGARTTRSVWVLPNIFQSPVIGTDPDDAGPEATPAGKEGQEAPPRDEDGHDATAPDGNSPEATPAGSDGQEAPPRDGGVDNEEDSQRASS